MLRAWLRAITSAWNPDNMGNYNDQGEHVLTYSLLPHKGNLASCDTVKYAYDLNLPMTAVKTEGKGQMASEFSLVSVDCDNIMVEAIKEAEYGDETIVRLYDCKNTRARTNVTFGFDISEAYIGNLSEKKQKKLSVKNNTVTVEVKPFEIVTLIVK